MAHGGASCIGNKMDFLKAPSPDLSLGLSQLLLKATAAWEPPLLGRAGSAAQWPRQPAEPWHTCTVGSAHRGPPVALQPRVAVQPPILLRSCRARRADAHREGSSPAPKHPGSPKLKETCQQAPLAPAVSKTSLPTGSSHYTISTLYFLMHFFNAEVISASVSF